MSKSLPKYLNISLSIISRIKSGELAPGMLIPSENEIRRRYEVSTTTARKVLQEIEMRGLVLRIKGKGTYVKNIADHPLIERKLGALESTRLGFDANMIKEGFVPSIRYLEREVIDKDLSFETNNQLYTLGAPVLKIRRLRLSDDIVLKDETRYVSLSICKDFDKLNFEDYSSFLNIYEAHYHFQITDVKQVLLSSLMSKEDQETFAVDSVKSLFLLKGATFIGNNIICEIEESKYHGDKYRFLIGS